MNTRVSDSGEFLGLLLKQINRNLPNSVLGGVLAASFLCYFYLGQFPDLVVFCWTGFIVTLFLTRGLIGYLYQRKSLLSDNQYLNYLGINILLSGLGWAAVSLLFVDPGRPFLMSISILTLAGVTPASMTMMNGLRRLNLGRL